MFKKLLSFFTKSKSDRLMPEAKIVVSFDDKLITVERPDGEAEKVELET